MDVFKKRLESFTRPKRIKGTAKQQTTLEWPHPDYFVATPETLAEAGFYFDPSSEDKDNVTCYMCGKQLGEWAENDDPFEIHFKKCAKKCAWANVRCGLSTEINADGRFIFTDKNRLPTSKFMEKARLDTFLFGEEGWIHDQERNHGASSKKMAKAGFVYAPHDSHDDTAACLYCGISLSGWDADDDPMEEHRKRVKKAGNPCPMFPDIVLAPAHSKARSHSRSKSKSAHVDVIMPTKTFDGSDDDAGPSVASTNTAKTPKVSRTAKKGARTPSAQGSSKARNIPVDHDEDEEQEPPRSTRKATKKPTTATTTTRSRSVSRTRSVTSIVDSDAGTGTEDEVALTQSANTRSRGKSKVADNEGSNLVSKKKATKTRSKSKSRVSVIPENHSGEDEHVPPVSTKKSLARKPSARTLATTKSASSLKQKDGDTEYDESDARVPAPANSNSKVTSADALFDDDEVRADDMMDVDEPEPATARPTRATRKLTKHLAQVQDASEVTKANKRGTHSRTASSASTRGRNTRPFSHTKENVDEDDPLENMEIHIPPASTPSVELELELMQTSTVVEKPPSRKQSVQKPPTSHLSYQELTPPPVPPRSPSRPKSKPKHTSEEMEVDIGVVPQVMESKIGNLVERASSSKPETWFATSGDEGFRSKSNKPKPPVKSAAMSKKGSYLDSRTSSQSQKVDQVLNISSDEDEEDEVEKSILRNESPVPPAKTKSKFLTNSKALSAKARISEAYTPAPAPASTKSSFSTTDVGTLNPSSKTDTSMNRLTNNVFEEGNVQAKIARIEQTAESESENGGRTSPFKPKLTSTNSSNSVNVEMTGLSDTPAEEVTEAKEDISPLPRPAVTPPRSQQQERPTSPFKTPFRIGGGPGNPFSVPPTPGAPLNIPLGVPIPLSNQLFVPTQDLSEAELSMTVEEWVRHHMQIEYAKLKEDGDREIAAFTSKAEQTRRVIEAL